MVFCYSDGKVTDTPGYLPFENKHGLNLFQCFILDYNQTAWNSFKPRRPSLSLFFKYTPTRSNDFLGVVQGLP